MNTVAKDLDELRAEVGSHLGYSGWHTVTQDEVNLFADATSDHQWIHVDPERAKAGPFGTTIAHGYFTLSLGPYLLGEILSVEGPRLSRQLWAQPGALPVACAGWFEVAVGRFARGPRRLRGRDPGDVETDLRSRWRLKAIVCG